MTILSSAYLAPTDYFRVLFSDDETILESAENYEKQSYRNRCRILTANGAMNLTIPVEKRETPKTAIRDVRIDNSFSWQQQHWRALEAAYLNSPFFEYYADCFLPFYSKTWDFLWDFNLELQYLIMQLLDIDKKVVFTENYQNSYPETCIDFRNTIHPKKTAVFLQKSYYQVFNSKFGFVPNLSIVDLLFNLGNESVLYLFCKT